MPKKKNTKSRAAKAADTAVVILCLAGAAAFLYLFYLDLYQSLSRSGEPVGIVTVKYGTVQRRFERRVLWDHLQQESFVYGGDFIRTSGLSEAGVNLGGETLTEVGENTIIQITAEGTIPFLNIVKGSARTNATTTGMVVSVGGSRLVLDGSSRVNISSDDAGVSFQVDEGTAVLSSGGESLTAQAGEAFSLAAGSATAIPARFSVLSPSRSARALVSQKDAASFEFRWTPATADVRVEASADKAFGSVAATAEGSGGRLGIELPAGRWFWRAYEPSAPEAAPLEGTLNLVYAPPPRLLAPRDDEALLSRSGSSEVNFRWSPGADAAEGASYYLLEAADNPALANPVSRARVSGTSAALRLSAGRWYWRVTPVYNGYSGSPALSEISSFTLAEGLIAAPVLTAPEEGAHINTAAGSRQSFFSWRRTEETPRYTILISQNADMSAPRISRQLTENYYTYDPSENSLAAGRYYWAVTAGTGANAVLSEVRSFTAEPNLSVVTALFPPDGYTVAEALVPELRFGWKSSRRGPVRFQLSRSESFSDFVVDREVSGEGFRCESLAPAVYYWRVASAEDRTPARRIAVGSQLPPPEIAGIGQNGVLSLKRGDGPTAFTWNAVEGANYYLFHLYSG
ncbi:MAG: hypothetical protein FWG35_05280, partial [Spirochaetaceae bacterium]|nr:hypothetical protein [Spirochaetaceae bacterium]